MWPLIGGLLSGGASLLGSIFSSNTSASNTQANIAGQEAMQREAQNFNAGQAQINRDFQADQIAQQRSYETTMSNTAYQRSRADMAAAGLNPILAASAGGASTPSVSAASGNAASIGAGQFPRSERTSPFAGLGDAVSKAVSTAISAKTFDKMTQEVANMQAEEALTKAKEKTEEMRPSNVEAGTLLTRDQAATIANRMPAARLEGVTAQDILDMPAWLRAGLVKTGWASDKAGKAVDLLGGVVSSARGVRGLLPRGSKTETTRSNGDQTFTERWDNLYGGYGR